jgi:hypothetical protein
LLSGPTLSQPEFIEMFPELNLRTEHAQQGFVELWESFKNDRSTT